MTSGCIKLAVIGCNVCLPLRNCSQPDAVQAHAAHTHALFRHQT